MSNLNSASPLATRLNQEEQDEFGIDVVRKRKSRRTDEERRLVRKLGAQTSARVAAEEQLDKLRSDRQGGSLTLSTLVRVALADPGLNGRRLRDILSLEGSPFISASYAAKVKDAFVELLKDVCKQHIRAQVAASPRAPSGQIVAPVFVTHVHDDVHEIQEL